MSTSVLALSLKITKLFLYLHIMSSYILFKNNPNIIFDQQEHDSYRVFRSQNLSMNIGLETKTHKKDNTVITPVIEALFYGSTLRYC